jgi:hypothetical protein
MKTIRIAFVLSVITLLAGTASAQPAPIIKLNVSLQLTTLNEGVEAVRVEGAAFTSSGATVADGAVDIQCPADGNINQPVVVQLKQSAGKDIREATKAVVILRLKVDGNWMQPYMNEAAAIEYRAKQGTQLIDHQDANITW